LPELPPGPASATEPPLALRNPSSVLPPHPADESSAATKPNASLAMAARRSTKDASCRLPFLDHGRARGEPRVHARSVTRRSLHAPESRIEVLDQ
jgi:hypothetical protein